ncbi:hypothetical protein QQS21_007396 [Conoideocrella luteorostrata]|uniref:Cytochrome P450 n=1 Tax=Conoideocrella luteorostrata TaxID=1105319 RepID=A0AAJ0FSG8_9HYPO|nr:hypothetical protein QQS21_007396 [Conoideocrella luteorostrata]
MTIVRISDEMQWHSVLWASLGVALVYILSKCFYNLFLHPLSGFPGPKLAAMSNMYEFWYDVVRDGTYIWQVEKMHQVYGPIVRVNVGELHIRDSEFYSSIYTSGTRKVNKDPDTYKAFGFPGSTGATIDHDLHRVRRGYMNPYFSKRAIVEMESLIHERTDRLFRRLEEAATNGTVVNLNSAFAALTADVITKRFYGEHFDFVGEPGFKAVATDAILGLSTVFNVARFFPGAVSAFTNLPRGIVRITVQPVAALLDFQDDVRAKILSCLKTVEGPQSKSIMASLLNDAHIPAEEKDIGRLVDDSISFVFGGTESTARTISTIVFHLLNNKTHLKKLREELDAVLPAQLDQHEYSMTQLRHLSYLVCFVPEALL